MDYPKTILYVEDDEDSSQLLRYMLEGEGLQVVTCSTSEEGLEIAERGGLAAIILDHRLANVSGIEMCRRIRTYNKQIPIIFYTASAYPADRESGIAAGANDYLVKPTDLERIVETINRLVW